MSDGRAVGEPGEVRDLAKTLLNQVKDIKAECGKGKDLISNLEESTKDDSLNECKEIVDAIAGVLLNSLENVKNVYDNLQAYASFLEQL